MSSISDDEWSAKLEESVRDEAASFYILSFRRRGAPHGTYESQRWPKRIQKAPKGPQGGFKWSPKVSRMVPRTAQGVPKSPQERPRAPRCAPRKPPRVPRMAQTAPVEPNAGPYAAKDAKTHDLCCPGRPRCSNISENARFGLRHGAQM